MNYDYRVSEDERTVIWCIANQVHLFYRLLVLNIFRDVNINLPQPEQLLARRADPRLHVALRLRHLQF